MANISGISVDKLRDEIRENVRIRNSIEKKIRAGVTGEEVPMEIGGDHEER